MKNRTSIIQEDRFLLALFFIKHSDGSETSRKIYLMLRTFFRPLQIFQQRNDGPSPIHDCLLCFPRIEEVARNILTSMSTFMLKKR